MPECGIQQASPNTGALSAEHYQSYEMAKANDSILGGDDIAQIRSYAAFARAQAQAIHKSIATMGELDDVAQAKAEMNETSQTFAKVSIYADTRIGEILRELPTRQGKRTDLTSTTAVAEVTKTEARKQAGFSLKAAQDFEAMAANPEVVEAVIARAEAAGEVVARKQITDEIKRIKAEKEQAERARREAEAAKLRAERERDEAHEALEDAYQANELLENENAMLKNQPKPQPEYIEKEVIKEVEPRDYRATLQRNQELEHRCNIVAETNKNLRSELDKAKDDLKKEREISGAAQKMQEVRRDVQYLISATNNYIREYGGLTWTVQQLAQVDDTTLNQLKTAAMNLAAFSSALVSSINEFSK